jgi:integrase
MVLLHHMQARFYIERRKDGSGNLMLKERPVFMSVSFRGDRVMLSTGIKTDFHGWDQERQRIKNSYPGSFTANAWLDTLAETAHKTWSAIRDSHEDPGAELFRNLFLELKPKYSTGFFDVFYRFMESGTSRWNTSTYRKIKTIYKHLREFENRTGYMVSFRSMDHLFLEKFMEFYAGKGNSKVTTYGAIKIIVWFMNWATANGFNSNLDYRGFYKLTVPKAGHPRDYLYLNWDELLKIRDFKTGQKKLQRARDLFCFMCFTGLRFSELQNLRKEDVEEEIVVRKKAGKMRRIPLNKKAREILGFYENRYYLNHAAFPAISLITLNKYLRVVGREAGLDRPVPGKELTGTKIPLYERLTAGIAVHTFIANAVDMEIPPEIISGFTGVGNDSRVRRIKMDLARKEMNKFDQFPLEK